MFSVVPRDPFLRDIRDTMQDFFRSSMDIETYPGSTSSVRSSIRSDLVEKDNEYCLYCELPGISKGDIDVAIEGNNVTVSCTKSECPLSSNEWYHFHERHFGKFQRTWKLPLNADCNLAVARNQDGVLILTIPKMSGTSGFKKLAIA